MDFVTVFKTLNLAEANLISAQLEAAGFEPSILNEFSSMALGSSMTAGSIRVQVPEGQSIDARALIDSTINSKTESDDTSTHP